MNRLLALCIFLATVAVVLADEMYTTKFDDINVDEVLGNERLMKVYKECMMADDDKNCPEEGKALRGVLSDALATSCEKCTEKQKEKAEQVIKWLTEHDPSGWQMLKNKWDPTGEYAKKNEEEAKKHGIKI